MKKQLLTLIAILLTTGAFAQLEVNNCLISMDGVTGPDFSNKNDTVSVLFEPTEFFWKITLTNNLKKDMSIAWDKSSFINNGKASRIIFGTTTRLTKDNPIQNEEVPSGSYISRKIFPLDNLMSESLFPTINKKTIKQRFEKDSIPDKRKIVIALLIGDELKKFDYNFSIIPKPKK